MTNETQLLDIQLITGDNQHKRFTPSHYQCPQCSGDVLEDGWPPNYGGGSVTKDPDGTFVSKSGGSVKCVCPKCRIAFRVNWYKETRNNVTSEKITISHITALVERDGKWLTPHDVHRQQFYDEHGYYESETYF